MRIWVVTLVVLGSCNDKSASAPGPTRPAAPPAATTQARLSSGPAMQTRLRRLYRLGLDRRVVAAAADLARLAGRAVEVKASWDEDRLKVTAGAEVVGNLPERPTFAEELALLEGWAKTLGASGSAAPFRQGAVMLSVDDALHVADTAGTQLVGPTRPMAIRDGLRAFSSLAVALPDSMGVADVVAGRALALLALARASGGADPVDEVLVAWALGATDHARTLARTLPPDHPVALFALGGLTRLPASDDTRWLQLRGFLDEHDRIGARAFLAAQPASFGTELHTLAARLQLGAFDDIAEVAFAAPTLLRLHAEREAGVSDATLKLKAAAQRGLRAALGMPAQVGLTGFSAALLSLDESIGKLPSRTSPLLAGEIERLTYRTLGYEAIYSLVLFGSRYLASADEAASIHAAVAAAGPFADAAPWADLLAMATSSRLSLPEAATGMKSLRFSNKALTQVFEQAHQQWGNQGAPGLLRVLADKLDGRPSHRVVLAAAAATLLQDLVLEEAEGRAAVAQDPVGTREWRLYFAVRDGQLPSLQPWLKDAEVPTWLKARLLGELVREKVLAAPAVMPLVKTLGAEGHRFGTTKALADVLRDAGQIDSAKQLYLDFFRDGEHEGLDMVVAHAELAKLLLTQKRYSEAWKVVGPYTASYQNAAMLAGARAQQGLGHTKEAEDLARRAMERYRGKTIDVAVLAEILWRQQRFDEAAQLLVAQRLNTTDTRFVVGERLVAAVEDGADARAIFKAFTAARLHPLSTMTLVDALAATKTFDPLVIELYSEVPAPGMMVLEPLTAAAAVVQRTQGSAAASAWLKAKVPPPLYGPLAQFAFNHHLDAALWDVIPAELAGPRSHNDNLWQFRAAAMLRSKGHSDELRRFFATASKDASRYFLIGQSLLGIVTDDVVLAEAKDLKSVAEVAYWLGYKAEAEHRLPEAIMWYRAAVETEQQQVEEVRFAYNRLEALVAARKSIKRLAAEPLPL